MCIDLYVDKVLVYSNCMPSPSPVSSLVPSPVPSPSSAPSPVSHVPSTVPSPTPSPVPNVPSPYSMNNTPSSMANPETNVMSDGYSLTTPSIVAMTKTTMSPSSSNSSNMTDPFGDSVPVFIENHGLATVIIVIATVLPTLLICILVYKKRPTKCKKPNKVQPEKMKKKKCCQCCHCCCKDKPHLPGKPISSTTTRTYLNQPPLPISLPPTPRETE